MKLAKQFVYLTTVLTVIGAVMLLNDGEFDVYGVWNLAGFLVASYLLHEQD